MVSILYSINLFVLLLPLLPSCFSAFIIFQTSSLFYAIRLPIMGLLPLAIALIVLMLDSAVELALISSMVGYLHRSGANKYPFHSGDGTATIQAKPKGLMLNQGHASNGAAGTALVAVSLGGFVVLLLQRRRERKVSSD